MFNKYTIGLGIIIIALILFGVTQCEDKIEVKKENKVIQAQLNKEPADTNIVAKIKPIEVTHITAPVRVKTVKKKNLIKRKKVESEQVQLGELLADGKLTVQKIDSSGQEVELEFLVAPTDQVKIDSKGDVEVIPDKKAERKRKQKKFFKRVFYIATVVVSLYFGSKF